MHISTRESEIPQYTEHQLGMFPGFSTGNENLNKEKIPLVAVDMVLDPKLLNGMGDLMLST